MLGILGSGRRPWGDNLLDLLSRILWLSPVCHLWVLLATGHLSDQFSGTLNFALVPAIARAHFKTNTLMEGVRLWVEKSMSTGTMVNSVLLLKPISKTNCVPCLAVALWLSGYLLSVSVCLFVFPWLSVPVCLTLSPSPLRLSVWQKL